MLALIFFVGEPLHAGVAKNISKACLDGIIKVAKNVNPFKADPDKLNTTQYDALRNKKIKNYSPEQKEDLLRDYRLVSKNYEKRFNNKKELPGHKEARNAWDQTIEKEAILKGALSEKPEITLEDFLQDRVALYHRPPDELTTKQKWRRLGVNTALFVPRMIMWAGKKAGLQAKFSISMALVPIFTFGIPLFVASFNNSLDKQWNRVLRNPLIWWQGVVGLGDRMLDSSSEELMDAIQAKEKEAKDVAVQLMAGEISQEDAKRVFDQLIKMWILQANAIKSTLPDNIKEGRALEREGQSHYNKVLETLTTLIKVEINQYKFTILYSEDKLRDKTLSDQERKVFEKSVADAKRDLENAETRIAGSLAQMAYLEFAYPEFNRAKFLKENPDLSNVLESYNVFNSGKRLKHYADVYFDQMNAEMKKLGLAMKKK